MENDTHTMETDTHTMETDKIWCEICDKEFKSQEAIDSHNAAKHSTIQKHKNHTFPIKTVSIIAILLLIVAGVVIFGIVGNKPSTTGNAIAPNLDDTPNASGTVQTATLRVSGSTYILEPSIFKKDIPVRLIADINSMPGCSKVVTIPAFNLLKYVDNKDNIITFTPTQTGTFRIACSMSMYTGTFTVE